MIEIVIAIGTLMTLLKEEIMSYVIGRVEYSLRLRCFILITGRETWVFVSAYFRSGEKCERFKICFEK